jgi:DNA-binding transcriptional MerR regulator
MMIDRDKRRDEPDNDEAVWFDDNGPAPPPAGMLLSIHNVAQMFSVSWLALLSYELRGLIKRRHRVGRTRVYGWADCDRIAFIIKGRRAGLTLADMTDILKAADEDAAPEIIKPGRTKCLDLIDRLDRRRQVLREALGELRHLYTLLSSKVAQNGTAPD